MITIIDYKTGNLGSIQNILKRIGEQSVVTSDINEIAKAKKLILPGVGAFDTGMRNLNELGLVEVLNEKVIIEKTPVLGICLGMQLLSEGTLNDFSMAVKQGGASAAAAGSFFVFHGKRKAVLITYPSYSEISELFK